MPGFWEVERPLTLDSGKTFVGLFKPTDEVSQKLDEKYGMRYTFRFIDASGNVVRIVGGGRLYDAIRDALKEKYLGRKPEEIPACWVRLEARGKAGTFDRGFAATIVDKPE